jgi:hypothetical protein
VNMGGIKLLKLVEILHELIFQYNAKLVSTLPSQPDKPEELVRRWDVFSYRIRLVAVYQWTCFGYFPLRLAAVDRLRNPESLPLHKFGFKFSLQNFLAGSKFLAYILIRTNGVDQYSEDGLDSERSDWFDC